MLGVLGEIKLEFYDPWSFLNKFCDRVQFCFSFEDHQTLFVEQLVLAFLRCDFVRRPEYESAEL